MDVTLILILKTPWLYCHGANEFLETGGILSYLLTFKEPCPVSFDHLAKLPLESLLAETM